MTTLAFSKPLQQYVDRKNHRFDYTDPIFSRSQPVEPWDVVQNPQCPVCEAAIRKNEKTFWQVKRMISKFCGYKCCKACALHKLPIPYKKETRSQICDLCNAKFNLLKLREEYQDRLDRLEKLQINMKKDLRFYTRESENLSIQLASVKHSADSELRLIKSELEKGRTTLEQMEMQNNFMIHSNQLISQHLQASTREYKQLMKHKDQIQTITEDRQRLDLTIRSNQLVERNLYMTQIQNEVTMQAADEKYLLSKLTKLEKESRNTKKKKKKKIVTSPSSSGFLTDDRSDRVRLLQKQQKQSEVVEVDKKGCCSRCIVF